MPSKKIEAKKAEPKIVLGATTEEDVVLDTVQSPVTHEVIFELKRVEGGYRVFEKSSGNPISPVLPEESAGQLMVGLKRNHS